MALLAARSVPYRSCDSSAHCSAKVPDLDGYDALSVGRMDKNLKGISYEDWKAGKNPPGPKEGSGRSPT